tara:strand:- start:153 stop:707 length:555 start_codon:yes stop_codon:yes gene_type:complete
MKQFDKGELAKTILLSAVAAGAVATVLVLPGLAVLFKELDARDARERYRVKRTVERLRQQGYLMREIKNGKERLVLASKGRERIADYLTDELYIPTKKRWDKKWRVVMFDIPEKKGRARRAVSWKIRDIGMFAIQNSVFISPYPCKKEIDQVTKHYGVEKYFVYFEAGLIECESDLLSIFNLRN